MKKLLLLAVALVAAGSISFAIRGGGQCDSANVEGAADLAGSGVLGTDDCLSDFFIVQEVPSTPGYCHVAFGIKHTEKSDMCCNHTAGTISISVNNGTPTIMTKHATEEGNPCDKDVYHSATYEVPDGQQLTWSISCSGHTSCCQSGTYTPHCSEYFGRVLGGLAHPPLWFVSLV